MRFTASHVATHSGIDRRHQQASAYKHMMAAQSNIVKITLRVMQIL